MVNNSIPLHESILRAKKAIKAAGFQSGSFKPRGGTLTVDVTVPVCFDDWTLDENGLRQCVFDKIADAVADREEKLQTPTVFKASQKAVVNPQKKRGRPRKIA